MIALALQAAVSAGTLTSMWGAADGRRWAWPLATINQFLWAPLIVLGRLWGLAPMAAALAVVFARNWSRTRRTLKEQP